MTNQYVFNSAVDLLCFIEEKSREEDTTVSNIRFNLTLYFLYAYYSVVYRNSVYPEELFPAVFVGSPYGPIESNFTELYARDDYYSIVLKEKDMSNNLMDHEIKTWMDGFLEDLSKHNDFALVDRSHEDDCVIRAMPQEQSLKVLIPNESIRLEYRDKYKQENEEDELND